MSGGRLEAAVQHGMLIGMGAEARPGNGLHNHTLRHWLSAQGELDAVKPAARLAGAARSAAQCREDVVAAGAISWSDLDAIPLDHARVTAEPRWWTVSARRAVLVAHDRGYWPVYLTLVRRAGFPGARTAGWRCVKGKRWQLDTDDGYIVAGDLDAGGKRLSVVTAHRSHVRLAEPSTTATSPPDDLFQEALARLRRRR